MVRRRAPVTARCLRCGAGNEWIEGKVVPDVEDTNLVEDVVEKKPRFTKEEILEHIRNGAGRPPVNEEALKLTAEQQAFQEAQIEAYGFVPSEPHQIGAPDTRDWLDLFREVSKLRVFAVEAHTALTKARPYVAGAHAGLSGVLGYNNFVLPDLQLVDKSLSNLWEVVTDVEADELARKEFERKRNAL